MKTEIIITMKTKFDEDMRPEKGEGAATFNYEVRRHDWGKEDQVIPGRVDPYQTYLQCYEDAYSVAQLYRRGDSLPKLIVPPIKTIENLG